MLVFFEILLEAKTLATEFALKLLHVVLFEVAL
jgi:hypothetical protein